jgi:hypothetical protein
VDKPIACIPGINAVGTKVIGIFPVPRKTYTKTTVWIKYWALDTDLSAEGSSFNFNAVYHPVIIDFVLAWCYFKDNQITNYNLAVERYEKRINEINPTVGMSPSPAGVFPMPPAPSPTPI